MESSSYHSNYQRRREPPYRQFRQPYRNERSYPPRQPYSLLLVRTVQNTVTATEIETLIQTCPNPPYNTSVHQSGRLAAVLTYITRSDAVAAASFFWKRRLAGSHSLSAKLNPPAEPDSPEFSREQRQISMPFLSYISTLIESDPAAKRCKEKIDQIRMEIRKVTQLLSARNKFAVFAELQEKKQSLQTELDQVESRLIEFKAAMDCIAARLRDGKGGEEEEEGNVRIFKLGKELDFDRIQALIVRECRRLNDGLPVYGCRSKILNHIFANQVMVLVGETGSGKSTQLVQYLADSNLTKTGSIVCTQPRKIAAITLAQRVSEESASCHSASCQNPVLSYPSVSSQNNFKSSRVIFTTDHCFLQHCMGFKDNNGLDNASYIIVDEAHERSLNTDLLLALIKKKLLERTDLRLIIMSATCDASKLASYFYGCGTVRVSGRTFPVEINYVKIQREINGFGNYVSDVLRTVEKVHKNESDGAILAFLTSQMEVEFACESFTDLTAVVLPMHGKLSAEEQSQVFKNYPGKRKIIFSTNIAETSLTIKGVKYVIDCGLVKESRFEPKNGMNVLKVNWISQSSAEQRTGRAGRTTAGKCFRLYTESEFREMELHQEPEIRKVHLGTAVLRILSLGVRNVRNFEFVDAPSQQAIETAVKNLIQLGAITSQPDYGHALTLTGQLLVKLGVEPRLGKIILDSFACGLKKEGLVLAAVMANASSIFCRVGSAEEKSKADCLKVPFCHSDGDLFTLLTVYKKWEEERENKNKWCWQNSINAKSMRRCSETVKELESCLKHETNTIVPSYWTWEPEKRTPHDKALKKIILSCLVENLAFFSGHERLGYQVALTGQNVPLHPSCSLYVSDRNPNWVVFGEILSVPNQYLVCVTAVDFDDLLAIESLPFDVKTLESRKLQGKRITGVSTSVLKRFCGRLCQNLHRFISQVRNKYGDERINIEADFETGEIQIFALQKDLNEIFSCLKHALNREEKWLKEECWEKALYPVRPGQPGQTALLGSGGLIKHLELEKRYLTIEIFHPNAESLTEKELVSFIDEQVYGGIVNVHKFVGTACQAGGNASDRWGRVTFLTPDKAEEAAEVLTGLTFEGADLIAVPVLVSGSFRREPFGAVRARLSWPRRPIRGIAILRCLRGEAPLIVQDMFTLSIGDRYVDCQVSTKYEDCIFVTGIPRQIPESQILSAFRNSTSRRILDIKLLRAPPAGDLPSESLCKDALVKSVRPFMPDKHFPEKNFRVEVFKPELNDYFMKAVITFDGSLHLEAAKALEDLEGSVLPGCQPWQVIECQHVFQSVLTCPNRVYNVVRDQIEMLLRGFQRQKGVSYNLERNENGLVRIKIIANATKTIADLRKPLEQLTKGKTLTLTHLNLPASAFNLILSRDGLFTINTVERETRTYILYDRQCLNIKIFGSAERIEIAERKLQDSLLQLQENKVLEVKLKGKGLPRDLMKEVIRRFGPDLGLLKEKAAGSEFSLNTKRHVLFVRGSKEDKMKVEEAIADVVASIGSDAGLTDPSMSESDSCPICLCELEEPYKLDSCGHKFCRGCLIDQIETSIRSRDNFPLCCLKQNCKTPILLLDLKALLSISRLDELFRASLGYFIATNSLIYRFCPTPDCPSVYKIRGPGSSDEEPFVCGACYTETCTKCSLEYHPFVTCEQYKEYKADPDLSLLEWRKGKKDVRNCPSNCGFIIEKVDGCDHVKCKCEKHVCWGCMKYFETENECYAHIHAGHGQNNNNDDEFIIII
ncbi:hypothetical protein LUZ60_006791 [Juncus effusus]|nr:hypothetical protein LUZ60_006791 [Juncus effusus]